jgi:hypothetical protein
MEIIIKDEIIDANHISLKQGQNNIKILYHLNPIYVIGICLKLRTPFKFFTDNLERIELQNKQQIEIFNKINSYLSSMIVNYSPFIKNNTIFVKNNSSKDNVFININNIKTIQGKNFVNIFSL